MDKLANMNKELIENTYQTKSKGKTDGIKIRHAKVVSVEEDYSYATVKLFGDTGQILKLINKTGEKLHTGDGVRIEFSTDITCGWIAVRNGKADPLCAELTIKNAPIVPRQISNAYLQDAEIFNVDVKNQSVVTYGTARNRIIVQGFLMPVYYDSMPDFVSSEDSHIYDASKTSDPNFYTMTSKQKKFFEENIDCVMSEIPGDTLVDEFGSTYYSMDLQFDDCRKHVSGDAYNFLWSLIEREHGFGDLNSMLYTHEKPTTAGILPVVVGISSSLAYVKFYAVTYNGSSLTDVIKLSARGDTGVQWSENEYDYAMNVITRSEIKPSEL